MSILTVLIVWATILLALLLTFIWPQIKEAIGNYTFPYEAYRCEAGRYWVVYHYSLLNWGYEWEGSTPQKYQYREIVQDRYGRWVEGNTHLGLNSPLERIFY